MGTAEISFRRAAIKNCEKQKGCGQCGFSYTCDAIGKPPQYWSEKNIRDFSEGKYRYG